MTIIPREPFDLALSDHIDVLGTIQKADDVIKGLADGSLDEEDRRLVQEAIAAMIGLLQ